MEQNLLEIKNLRVHYVTDTEDVQAVNGVDLHLKMARFWVLWARPVQERPLWHSP